MKKRFLALMMAALMILAITACGSNPDGKKLLEDAANNKEPITYSSMEMNMAMEEPESGIAMEYYLKVEGDTEVAYTDLSISVMGIAMKGDFYIDAASGAADTYFKGIDGKWYKVAGDEVAVGDVSSMSSSINAESLAMLTGMCSEINTVGKENFNGTSAYKVQMVLDLTKAFELYESYVSLEDLGISEEDLNASEEAIKEFSNIIELYTYIDAGTPKYLGMYATLNKDAIKKLAAQSTTDAEALNTINTMLETMEFDMTATAEYGSKTLSLPAEAASATLLTDPEEIAAKMPLLSALQGMLEMAE
ncbi:MAG: hypothetical protein E7328_05615 [Clostridiales bacterium]|nr:hypothetical protein [Clostridiales bacterium]